jgi:hypothetical protein
MSSEGLAPEDKPSGTRPFGANRTNAANETRNKRLQMYDGGVVTLAGDQGPPA